MHGQDIIEGLENGQHMIEDCKLVDFYWGLETGHMIICRIFMLVYLKDTLI